MTETPKNDPFLDLVPHARRQSWWERMWRPFWVLPVTILVAATVLGVVLPLLDRSFEQHLPWFFQGGPSGARDLLGNIAGAMISVTGLVFSITMVVVQLASSQFTPRALDDFLASRVTQTTLGVFASSFVFALTVSRSVRDASEFTEPFVPQISVTIAFLLVLTSIGMFMAFINHITNSIKVTTIVSHLGERTVRLVDDYFPNPTRFEEHSAPSERFTPPIGATFTEVLAKEHGNVTELHHRGMLRWAIDHDAVVEAILPVGRFVVEGAPALRIWHADAAEFDSEAINSLRRHVVVEKDRRFTQDPAFGIRKLVDIAERALSSGINDPTTAVQVLDELHRVMRLLVQKQDLPRVVTHEGRVRLVHQPQRIHDLIDLTLEEVLHYAEDTLQVPRRVVEMLDEVEAVTLDAHRDRLEHWRRIARELEADASRREPSELA